MHGTFFCCAVDVGGCGSESSMTDYRWVLSQSITKLLQTVETNQFGAVYIILDLINASQLCSRCNENLPLSEIIIATLFGAKQSSKKGRKLWKISMGNFESLGDTWIEFIILRKFNWQILQILISKVQRTLNQLNMGHKLRSIRMKTKVKRSTLPRVFSSMRSKLLAAILYESADEQKMITL